MFTPVIEVKNLVKRYEFYRKRPGLWGTVKSLFYRKTFYADAVKNISFSINEGEILGFLGPNGAGKTTTLKMLSGILYPTSGDIRVLGFTPQDRKKDFKKQFGIVMGQKDQLVQQLPPMDNFLLFKQFCEISDEEFNQTIKELIALLDLESFLDIQVRKLSLGQRMRVELAAALLHKPRILFLDEPTIGLDVVAQKQIREFIRQLNSTKKTTIILTSHYMDDIRELCKRVIIVNLGKVIYDGPLDRLISKYAREKVIKVTMTEDVTVDSLEKYGKVENFQGVSALIRVSRERVKEVASSIIQSNLPIDDILIDEMPIDDIIRKIFGEKV